MNRHFLTITMSAAMIVALLAGCSSDIGEPNSESGHDFAPIAFSSSDIKEATRGQQITKDAIDYFGVSSSMYPASSTYTDIGCGSFFFNIKIDAATGESGYNWPGSDCKVSFFAYAPYDNPALTINSADDKGYPQYKYTVPEAIVDQIDFVTSDIIDESGAAHTAPVPLTFHHRCADIRFLCENVGAEDVTLKSVAIIGVKYSGTFSGQTWTLEDDVRTFTLEVEQTIAPDAQIDVTGTTNHFIMLPQTASAGQQLFDVYATVGGKTQHFYYTPSNDQTLDAGKVYTFTLKLSDLLVVDEQTDIRDWGKETDRSGLPEYEYPASPEVGIGDWNKEEN